ncbi:MAG: hypothetical protein ACOY5R_21585 [Pseudomonadota bacterium]
MARRRDAERPSAHDNALAPSGTDESCPDPGEGGKDPIIDDEPSADFLDELRASWTRHGARTIDKVRADRPHDYLRLIASALAKRPEDASAVDTLTDDEIADELQRILAALAATGADPRAGTQAAP